ncbi:MAG: alpha/beta hydrolase fold domain-containing protein, partial [Dehalococcoidia bacterium]|nr:alpha/beta hydrolase fold domain-containing protein [Dehalococcoidia bacterium]
MKWRVELSDDEVRATLEFLEVQRAAPSRQFLARLQRAYKVRVPWETASRVVRASEVRELEERPRRPPEFWALAMEQGSGGTCFESNYAFWALLRGLGFEVALHVNDMPQDQLIACHSSLVVAVDGERYLADVGMGMQLVALAPAWEIGAVAARARGLEAAASVPAGPEMARVEERRVPGPAGDVPVRVYWPSEAVGLPILVWFHGGGWVLGSVAESEPVCRRLAERAGVIVVSVEYRMAPEDP